MTDEPKNLIMRFHKSKIIRETEDTIMLNLGNPEEFFRLLAGAMTNPGMAVTKKEVDE